MSYFKTPGQLIYGHCEVHICDPNAETCAPSCDRSRKRCVINKCIQDLCMKNYDHVNTTFYSDVMQMMIPQAQLSPLA